MARIPQKASEEDIDLAQRVSAGNAQAKEEFSAIYGPIISKSLASRARDPNTRRAIEEITLELLGDCLKTPLPDQVVDSNSSSLLVKYLHPRPRKDTGEVLVGPLEAWIRRVAINRFLDWLEINDVDVDPLDDEQADTTSEETSDFIQQAGDKEVVDLLKSALEYGFAKAQQQEPLGLISLLLVWLYGVQRRQLAVAWDRHQANVTPHMDRAMQTIRRETLQSIHRIEPLLQLTWKDMLLIAAKHPEIIRRAS